MRALCWHFGMMARSCRRRCALAVDGATLPQRRNPGLGSVFGRGGGRRRIGGRVRRLVMARLYMLRRGVRFLREKPAASSSQPRPMHRGFDASGGAGLSGASDQSAGAAVLPAARAWSIRDDPVLRHSGFDRRAREEPVGRRARAAGRRGGLASVGGRPPWSRAAGAGGHPAMASHDRAWEADRPAYAGRLIASPAARVRSVQGGAVMRRVSRIAVQALLSYETHDDFALRDVFRGERPRKRLNIRF